MDNTDEDDEPLVFKRSSSSSKQNQSNPQVQKSSLSQKLDRLGRPMPDVRSQNGQSSGLQKGNVNLWMKVEKRSSGPSADPYDSDDSEDDKPLSARLPTGLSRINSNNASKGSSASRLGQKPSIPKQENSDDEKPLSYKVQLKTNVGTSSSKSYDSDEEKPLAAKNNENGSAVRDSGLNKPSTVLSKRSASEVKSAGQASMKKHKLSVASVPINNKQASVKAEQKVEDDDDHVPISQRLKIPAASDKKSSAVKKVTKVVSSSLNKTNKKSKKVMKQSQYIKSSKVPPGSGEGQKWTTLIHNGVIFPPPYQPHGVKILYKGKPVDLTPEQEEVNITLSHTTHTVTNFSLVHCVYIFKKIVFR
ncbi:DNA topoisomerase 1 alpha-like, partial [Olea europaea var. sylvestris]|uniref:DNA topoisomerase 1 alpha-like n=1 Tax=Olea europaea var. sylvestris TaxID=158386 RepID=UPI000C1D14AD